MDFRFIVFITHSILAILSMVLIGLGIAHLTVNFPTLCIKAIGIIISVTGFLMFMNSYMGCCIVFLDHAWIIKLNASLSIFLLSSLLISCCIAIKCFITYSQSEIDPELKGMFLHMTNEKLTAKFQRKHSCCGVNSVNDWNSIIPASCCKSNVLKCEREKAFTKGCKDQLIYETRLWIISTGIVAFFIALLLLINIIFSFIYAKKVHYEAPLPKSAGISRLSRYTTRLLSIDLDTGNVGNTSEGGKSFFARFRSNPT